MRTRELPAQGRLLLSTDLHGNLSDFRQLRKIFLAAPADTFWVQLGDIVHGPDALAMARFPKVFESPDASWFLVEEFEALRQQYPERIFFVLGNHEHGHLGGIRTRKFHPDEVGFLESRLGPGRAALASLLDAALVALRAPCGLLLCHACPDATLRAWEDLATLPWVSDDPYQRRLVEGFLWQRGQRAEVTGQLLDRLGLQILIHGHEIDPLGWYSEHSRQFCPVIFGAPREERRYLYLDLGARYVDAQALRVPAILRRLHVDPLSTG